MPKKPKIAIKKDSKMDECPICGGSGSILSFGMNSRCHACRGRGLIHIMDNPRDFKAKIKPKKEEVR